MKKLAMVLLGLSLGGCAMIMDEVKHPIQTFKNRHHRIVHKAPVAPAVVAVPVKPVAPGTFEIKPDPTPPQVIKRRWLPHVFH
jgi:hypothetical protein